MTDMDVLSTRVHEGEVLGEGLHLMGPSLYQSNYSNGITYGSVIESNNGASTIDVSELLAGNQSLNKFVFTTNLQFGGIKYSTGNIQWGIDYGVRLYAGAGLNENLISLIAEGNAQYIGQRIDITPEFRGSSFHEIGISFAKNSDRFTYGAKLKILAGVDDLHATGGRLSLLTEEEFFQLNFDNDFTINSSSSFNYQDLSDFMIDFDYINFGSFFTSKGASLDLGLQYRLSDSQKLYLDVKDIGFIKWNRQVSNYTSQDQYSYEGIDIIDFVDNVDGIDVVDSLSNILRVEQTNDSYSYSLPLNVTASYHQQINDKTSWALLAQYHRWKRVSLTVLSGGIDYRWKDYLGLTGSYTYVQGSPVNIGFGFSGELYGVSYFFNTDNILGVFNLQSANMAHIHMGGAISL